MALMMTINPINALGQGAERRLPLPRSVAADRHHETAYRPKPTHSPHAQEDEAGIIANLQLRSLRPNSRMCTGDAHFCRQQHKLCGRRDSCYAGQTLRQTGGTQDRDVLHSNRTFNEAAIISYNNNNNNQTPFL